MIDKGLDSFSSISYFYQTLIIIVVIMREEVKAVLSCLEGEKWHMASLVYGSGLRLMECLRLRIQDIDFGRGEIFVRDGKGAVEKEL